MKGIRNIVALIVLLILTQSSAYTVSEYQQALVLQLGKIQGSAVTQPGLHWKIPFIQEIKYFDKRILQWDGEKGEIPTKDKKFIWVDTTARWRIADPLQFYRAVQGMRQALFRMGTIIDGATKDTVSNYALIESVRNSNQIFDDVDLMRHRADQLDEGAQLSEAVDELPRDVARIEFGREKLSEMIASRARSKLVDLGIELIDVQLRSIGYQDSVEAKVHQSMIAEREQIASKIRSFGRAEEARIFGQLDLQLKTIESDAFREAENIRGEADAKAAKIYADAFNLDPEFYAFVRNLELYKDHLGTKGHFILSTGSSFLQLLQSGKAPRP